MKNIDFKQMCCNIRHSACVMSVKKNGGGNGEFRIVDGNEAYLGSFNMDSYKKHEFIPNSLYTDYLPKNLNFEDYCFRCAVGTELLHSYAYPENFHSWIHMLFIPLSYETEELAYCLYVMEISQELSGCSGYVSQSSISL